jgi:hypothetical protein
LIKDGSSNLFCNPQDSATCFADYFTNIFTASNPSWSNKPPVLPSQEQNEPFVSCIVCHKRKKFTAFEGHEEECFAYLEMDYHPIK